MIREMRARRLGDAPGLFGSKTSPLWARFDLGSPISSPLSSLQGPAVLTTRAWVSPGWFTAESQSQEDNRYSRNWLKVAALSSVSQMRQLRLRVHPAGQWSVLLRLWAENSVFPLWRYLPGRWSQDRWSLPSAAEWGAGPGLHCLPALILGPSCQGCWTWKLFRVESGRLKANHPLRIPAPPTLLSQKWIKWVCHFQEKDGQTVCVGNDNSQALKQRSNVGKLRSTIVSLIGS